MFTFDDLIRLTPQAVQVLLRAIEKDKLPVALKGASEKLRDMFFKNMSDRAGKILKDDMEASRPGAAARCGRGAGRHRRAGQGAGGAGRRSRSPRARTRRWSTRWTASSHRARRGLGALFAEDFDLPEAARRTRGDRAGVLRQRTGGGARGGWREGTTRACRKPPTAMPRRRAQAIAGDRRAVRRRSARRPRRGPSSRPRRSRGCCWTAWRRCSRHSARATATRRCARSCAPCCRR